MEGGIDQWAIHLWDREHIIGVRAAGQRHPRSAMVRTRERAGSLCSIAALLRRFTYEEIIEGGAITQTISCKKGLTQ